MKRTSQVIKSPYFNKQIKTDTIVNTKTNRLVIFLHGAYSSPYEQEETKIKYLAKELSKYASVSFYQTSRLLERQNYRELSFNQFIKKGFKRKTFRQELVDVELAFKAISQEVKRRLVTKRLRISLVGFSLGGVMSIELSTLSKEINNIILLGSSSRFVIPGDNWHLLASMPRVSHFKKLACKYQGSLTMIHAEKDEYVKKMIILEWFNSFDKARIKQLIELKGVDHRFKVVNGTNKETDLKKMLKGLIYNSINL